MSERSEDETEEATRRRSWSDGMEEKGPARRSWNETKKFRAGQENDLDKKSVYMWEGLIKDY